VIPYAGFRGGRSFFKDGSPVMRRASTLKVSNVPVARNMLTVQGLATGNPMIRSDVPYMIKRRAKGAALPSYNDLGSIAVARSSVLGILPRDVRAGLVDKRRVTSDWLIVVLRRRHC
jgi:hypothetical protein